MRVGVVGAGLSGLLCAQRLSERASASSSAATLARLHISVLEWGRGPGGRTARRRVTTQDGVELSFDHAAPYFSARTDAFRGLLASWQAAGVAAPWPAGSAGLHGGEDVWVGAASSNAIARHLVAQLEGEGASMLFGHHVLAAVHDGAVWRLSARDRATGTTSELAFDALVLSDKLLVLQDGTYSVLAPRDAGALTLPPSLVRELPTVPCSAQ
jgi:renalase